MGRSAGLKMRSDEIWHQQDFPSVLEHLQIEAHDAVSVTLRSPKVNSCAVQSEPDTAGGET
jgi:hypothetical protein